MHSRHSIVPLDHNRTENYRVLQAPEPFPLKIAGQIANHVAGQNIFQRYLSEKAANTIKRHARDLELFAEYLLDVGLIRVAQGRMAEMVG